MKVILKVIGGEMREKVLFNNVMVNVNYSEVFVIVGFFGFLKIIFLDVLVGCIDCNSFKG